MYVALQFYEFKVGGNSSMNLLISVLYIFNRVFLCDDYDQL